MTESDLTSIYMVGCGWRILLAFIFIVSLSALTRIQAAPTAPSGLSATAGASYINLTWTDNSNNETNFQVMRSTDNITFTALSVLGANVTAYRDRRLASATTYYYKVAATNSSGSSAFTSSATATVGGASAPIAPTGLGAVAASSSQINLSWTDNSNNETSFRIERCTDNLSYVEITSTAANVTTYNDTGLSSSTTYYYRVRARNGTGNSSYTNISLATTSAGPGQGFGNPIVITNVGSGPYGVAAADFNGDGFTDIAVTSTGFGSRYIIVDLLGASGNVLSTTNYTYFGSVANYPTEIVAADFNQDTYPDIAFLVPDLDSVGILINQGNGNFNAAFLTSAIDHSSFSQPRGLLAADMDSDGYPDLVTTNWGYDAVNIPYNDQSGSFGYSPDLVFGSSLGVISTAVGDFNNDGIKDLATADYSANTISRSMGLGNYAFDTPGAIASCNSPTIITSGDLDNDLKDDLVVYCLTDSWAMVLLSDGSGAFNNYMDVPMPATAPYEMALQDVDADGNLDLVATGGGRYSIYFGNGTGFVSNENIILNNSPIGLAFGPPNGDGSLPIFTVKTSANEIYYDNHP